MTPEQLEKAQACKTPEDVLALAKAEGYELTDEELELITGGAMVVNKDGWRSVAEEGSK